MVELSQIIDASSIFLEKRNQRNIYTREEPSEEGRTLITDRPVGVFPTGTVEANEIIVNMAVGMYQFHDLIASRNQDRFLGTKYTKKDLWVGILNV